MDMVSILLLNETDDSSEVIGAFASEELAVAYVTDPDTAKHNGVDSVREWTKPTGADNVRLFDLIDVDGHSWSWFSVTTIPITPKRRGPRTSKIADAFNAIPSTPVLAIPFCKQHGIVITTLAQLKKYDKQRDTNPVHIESCNGRRFVWRGKANLLKDTIGKMLDNHQPFVD